MSQRANVRVSEETEEERFSRLADLSQRANVHVSEETEEERSSRLIDARIRTAFRVSEETIDDRLQVMSDRAYVRRTVLTPPVSGEEQRRLHQLSKDLEKFRSEALVIPASRVIASPTPKEDHT